MILAITLGKFLHLLLISLYWEFGSMGALLGSVVLLFTLGQIEFHCSFKIHFLNISFQVFFAFKDV